MFGLSLAALHSVSCLSLSGVFDVRGEGEETSSMPQGWTFQTLDDAGENPVTSPYLSSYAYKDSQKGNSLKLSRRVSAYQLFATSEYFDALPNTSYKVEFSYRTDCLDDDENLLTITVMEKLSDGSILSSDVASEKGRQSIWASSSGYYVTSETCTGLSVKVSSSGYGDFYVADMTLKGRPSPSSNLMNYTLISGAEDTGTLSPLKQSALSDDCYAGEKALRLSTQGIKMKLGFLPVGIYELKFKYKHAAEPGSYGRVRLDNVTLDGTRLWYGDAVSSNDTNGTWASYSYRFQKSATVSCDIQWFHIYFNGTYLIDELGLYDEEGYNYVPDGGFEGYDMDGISLVGNASIVKNLDGTFNYAGVYTTWSGSATPKIVYSREAMDLENGKTYTLSYTYRNGYGSNFGGVNYGETTLVDSVSISETWQTKTVDFVADSSSSLSFCLGQGWGERLGYLKDISVKDSDGVECILAQVKEHVTDPADIGDNIFPYGQFDYAFPDDSSSSSYSEDTYSGETRSESSSSSSSSSSPAADSSSQNGGGSDQDGDSFNGANLALGLSVVFTVIATGGLVTSIVLLARKGKKHE